MSETSFSDEMLMAFADGELDPHTREKIELALETDDALVDRLAVFIETRSAAREAMDPLLSEPVPDELIANVKAMIDAHDSERQPENVVPFAPPAKPESNTAKSSWAVPLAASIALAVGGFAGFVIGTSGNNDQGATQMSMHVHKGLVEALNSVPSGEETTFDGSADRFRAIASFRNSDGAFCREFEVDHVDRTSVVAVACKPEQIWKVQFTVTANIRSNENYAPASSLDALEAYLGAIGAGEALSVEEEAAALSK